MSGICAIVNLDGAPVDPAVLQRMITAGGHRGPDGSRHTVQGSIAFGYLALDATAEAQRECQPLVDPARGVWLAADARLDNRTELIGALDTAADPTDADLILAAYLRWGKQCPERLRGDFAFVIWDERSRRLLCATDAFAVKPLHFAQSGSVVCIASEAQQILQHPAFPLRLDEIAVADFLISNFGDPERTLFDGISRLPAASLLDITVDYSQRERYWDLDPERRIRCSTDAEYAEQFNSVFGGAVKARLRTHAGKVAILVSGGLDSGAIAAVSQRLLQGEAGGPSLSGYSYTFPGLKACDERQYSSALTEELGIPIEYVNAEVFPGLERGDTGALSLENPLTDSLAILPPMLQKMRAEGARVVLTGHGGDDLLQGSGLLYLDRLKRGDLRVFADIRTHSRRKRIGFWQILYVYLIRPLLPTPILDGVRALAGRSPRLLPWIDAEFAGRTKLLARLDRPAAPRRFQSLGLQHRYEDLIVNRTGLRTTYLYDRVAHSCGIEARHPFLDRDLAEFLFAIPPEQVFQPGATKYILRKALDGLLPDRICWRWDKTRFESHFRHRIGETEREAVLEMLQAPLVAEMAFCSAKELSRAFDRFLAGTCSATDGMMLLFPVTMERWLRRHRDLL